MQPKSIYDPQSNSIWTSIRSNYACLKSSFRPTVAYAWLVIYYKVHSMQLHSCSFMKLIQKCQSSSLVYHKQEFWIPVQFCVTWDYLSRFALVASNADPIFAICLFYCCETVFSMSVKSDHLRTHYHEVHYRSQPQVTKVQRWPSWRWSRRWS